MKAQTIEAWAAAPHRGFRVYVGRDNPSLELMMSNKGPFQIGRIACVMESHDLGTIKRQKFWRRYIADRLCGMRQYLRSGSMRGQDKC